MKFKNEIERQLWQATFIAGIGTGYTHDHCCEHSDWAVEALRERESVVLPATTEMINCFAEMHRALKAFDSWCKDEDTMVMPSPDVIEALQSALERANAFMEAK